jgi:23S rRNA pseudouridine2605 synthase
MAKQPGKPDRTSDRKPQTDRPERKPRAAGASKSASVKSTASKSASGKSASGKTSNRGQRGTGRSTDRKYEEKENRYDKKPAFKSDKPGYAKKKWDREDDRKPSFKPRFRKDNTFYPKQAKDDGLIRLNRFLSNAGIASRRDADQLIELGLVSVNGKVVTEMGTRVDPKKDVVKYDDRNLRPEPLRYVLLNKPKDYLTTTDDPDERKTVMHLIREACKERIYPVGRLDRMTTGLLLFTNDGEMAKKLTSPKKGLQKIYQVETIEKVKGEHLDAIREGVKLEDGFIKADDISFVDSDPRQIGIRLHSGQNRTVRMIFEHFGYTVKKLDRVMFAGLTKKDLSRGRYRHLTLQEVNFLKMIR